MKDFVKTKVVTGLVVAATVILGGVAIFTAIRLYQLRQQSVALNAPESNPLAWDCSKYVFSMTTDGKVRVQNNSSRNESAQQAKVYVNNSLVATFDVPYLSQGQGTDLGTVSLPQTGTVQWKVVGTKDCQNSGSLTPTKSSCDAVTFTITLSPTPTLAPNVTPTNTPTPNPSATSSPTPTNKPTATPTGIASPTPTFPPPPSIPEPPECTAEKPSVPILTSVKKSGTEAVLTWTKVNLATHYVISYGTSADNLQYGVPNTGNTTTYTIGSLNSGTTYYFTVYAVNDCMPSDGSTILSSVAGTSTAQSEELPATGIPVPTLAGIGFGIMILLISIVIAL